ncbi:MAG: hypothetical protein IJX53_08680 [Clostridia bacterium]|nr:hypothetical protein [Clostridia bacterium]
MADRIVYSAAALRLVWDYAYATRTVPLGGLEAVYRRLPSAEAEHADISHGDGLYCKDSTTLWRFSHYAGTGYTLDDLLARYGVVSAAELASVSYTGPSESVGAIAPRESDAPAEIEALLALLRQSEVPQNPVYAEYVFPGEASAAYTAGKHASYFWRDITLTTKEGETLILSHFPTESMLVWQGETILTLPAETNRALMQYSFFMNETEVWAFYDAMEAFLATQGRGQSPGTTAVTTAPPGTMSDWMYTPLPGTTPIG